MKTNLSLLLLLAGVLTGAAMVSPAGAATSEETCPLIGPVEDVDQACRQVRSDFWAEVRSCMGRKQDEADDRAGKPTFGNSHTNRARLFYCDAEARKKLGLASN